MTIDIFWVFTGAIGAALFIFLLFEYQNFHRIPTGHPERGLYGFNIAFLSLALVGIFAGALYLEDRRHGLEALITAYPHARYAPERSGLRGESAWVYITPDDPTDIVRFYRSVASSSGETFELDLRGDTPRFLLTNGGESVFLTIRREGGRSVLYYSHEGEVIGTTTIVRY